MQFRNLIYLHSSVAHTRIPTLIYLRWPKVFMLISVMDILLSTTYFWHNIITTPPIAEISPLYYFGSDLLIWLQRIVITSCEHGQNNAEQPSCVHSCQSEESMAPRGKHNINQTVGHWKSGYCIVKIFYISRAVLSLETLGFRSIKVKNTTKVDIRIQYLHFP